MFDGSAGAGGDAQGDTFTSIENLSGSAFDDVFGGTNGVNVLCGGGGSDQIFVFLTNAGGVDNFLVFADQQKASLDASDFITI